MLIYAPNREVYNPSSHGISIIRTYVLPGQYPDIGRAISGNLCIQGNMRNKHTAAPLNFHARMVYNFIECNAMKNNQLTCTKGKENLFSFMN